MMIDHRPASAHFADRPVPAPAPMIRVPAATWARRRSRACSLVMGSPFSTSDTEPPARRRRGPSCLNGRASGYPPLVHGGGVPAADSGLSRSGVGVSSLKKPAKVWSTCGIAFNVARSGTPSPF